MLKKVEKYGRIGIGDNMDNILLIIITLFFLAVVLIVGILNVIQHRKNKNLKKQLEKLEIEKNMIDSTPIIPELAKLESFSRNEKLELMYNEWKERLDNIKGNQIPKLTDMIVDAEYLISQMDYKGALYKIAKLEMEIYKVKTSSDFLLNEIKQVTTSEERNRAIITKLKAKYRDLYKKYNEDPNSYGPISKSVSLQFENIAKRFEDFEKIMETNQYTEVTSIVKVIDELLKHMEVVIEELPSIVLLSTSILPKKIEEVKSVYDKMVKENYPLDYLNVEDNISEANKKISDILDRGKVLNIEDSLFELKVLSDYFDNLFTDFEKEKVLRKTYEDASKVFKNKLDKLNKLVNEIFAGIDDIKKIYNLSNEEMDILNQVNEELKNINDDYKVLVGHTSNHTFAYSKLTKEIEVLTMRLSRIEEILDTSLSNIGNMHDDELRARQQLEEIKIILKESKDQIRDYNLPLIPKSYYTELNEASEAIKEIVKELDKTPITIATLNTRVDTARDLALKLFSSTKEMMKTAMFAEMAIVYGNRYRTSVEDLDKELSYSEVLFYKGEYQKSLESTINILNKVEPGIYEKLLNYYEN